MPKGTYAAYAQAKGVGENISKNIQRAEQMGFRYKREERIIRDKSIERNTKLAKQMGKTLEEMQIDNTEVNDIDRPVMAYLMSSSQEITDLYDRIAKNPEDPDARLLLEKKVNSAKQLKGFATKWRDAELDFKEGMQNGTYSKTLNGSIRDEISSSLLNGQYKIINDKNGDMQMLVAKDGDGKINDISAVNIKAFLAGNDQYNPKLKTDIYEAQDAIAERFGTVDITTDEEGYTERKYKGFNPENAEALRQDVDEVLGSSKESMTDAAISIIGDSMGYSLDEIDNMNEKEFKAIKDDFSNDIINTFDKTISNTDRGADRRGDAANARANGRYIKEMEEDGKQPEIFNTAKGGDGKVVKEKGGTVLTMNKSLKASYDGYTLKRVIVGDDENHTVKVIGTIAGTRQEKDSAGNPLWEDDKEKEPKMIATREEVEIKDETVLNNLAIQLPVTGGEEGETYANFQDLANYSRERWDLGRADGYMTDAELDAMINN